VTDSTTTPRTSARTWRARAAEAAVADLDRAGDAGALEVAGRVVDRGLFGALTAFAGLALFGLIAGWTTTAELLRPPDVPVHAPAMLFVLVATPWLLLLIRAVILVALRRRAMPILGRVVPTGFLHAIGRLHPADADPSIVTASAKRVGDVLANGSGRRVAAAGTGVFWTMFALAAVATIWLTTARVALGFGWESSWLSPRVGQAITDLAAAPLAPLIGPEELQPVAAPPTTAADDAAALAVRRRWIRFLTAGVVFYLLAPMVLWTVANAAIGHWLAERWRPSTMPVVSPRREGPRPGAASDAAMSRAADGDARPDAALDRGPVATHVVRLERPSSAPPMPPSWSSLVDLGDLDTADAIDRTVDAIREPESAIVVLTWLPATPDRGVRRRLRELAERSANPPRLVLDGGDHLRRTEPASTVSLRLADWRAVARDLGLPMIEVDLAHRTSTTEAMLAGVVAGTVRRVASTSPGAAGPRPLDPARLDAAFAAIGRHLDAPDDPLPSDAAHAAAVRAIVEELGAADAGASRLTGWASRLTIPAGVELDRPGDRLTALARGGLDLLPGTIRTGAVWAGLGGLLGASACIAAATLAPATLVALPGWIGSGAGLGGVLSLTRRRDRGDADPGDAPPADDRPRLDDRVPTLATLAVLLWSQGGDEARTTRLLHAVLPEDRLPTLDDADAARRWLAAVRTRVPAAAGDDA